MRTGSLRAATALCCCTVWTGKATASSTVHILGGRKKAPGSLSRSHDGLATTDIKTDRDRQITELLYMRASDATSDLSVRRLVLQKI
jgi:hypothetical protein